MHREKNGKLSVIKKIPCWFVLQEGENTHVWNTYQEDKTEWSHQTEKWDVIILKIDFLAFQVHFHVTCTMNLQLWLET